MLRSAILIGVGFFSLLGPSFCPVALAGDWPMWRYDAGRTAATPHALPSRLSLQWVRDFPPPHPAWPPTQPKLGFDRSYEPVVMGQRLFVGSTVDDSLRAFSTRNGRELWRFYAEGPVRFAPVAVNGRVYFVSDDGFLYCLNAEDGRLLWKVNGGPAERPLLGNRRLISTWPARGGPVFAGGVIYFAAGIWPSMGIFIHAVDAKTGRLLWTNSRTGSLYVVHPHGAPAFGSIVPQGHLVVNGNALIVPGGRSTPAVLDRKTGKLRFFQFDQRAGGHRVCSGGPFYFVGGERYALENGADAGTADPAVITPDEIISVQGGQFVGEDLRGKLSRRLGRDRKGKLRLKISFSAPLHWKLKPVGSMPRNIFLKAGDRIFAGGKNRLAAFVLPKVKKTESKGSRPLEVTRRADWSADIEGNVSSLLAADDRLFVVTAEGRLYCFGREKRKPVRYPLRVKGSAAQGGSAPRRTPAAGGREKGSADKETAEAAKIVADVMRLGHIPSRNAANGPNGAEPAYAVVFGLSEGGAFPEELVRRAHLHVIVVADDATAVERFRRRNSDAGLYGRHLSARVGNGVRAPLPPYLASFVFCPQAASAGLDFTREAVQKLYHVLRPYGGTAVLKLSDAEHERFRRTVKRAALPGSRLRRDGGYTLLIRAGRLPGSADWTHQYADAGNSVVSRDTLVKAPLGVLWFGGVSNEKILPRHGHGPNPQVAGGRIVIEGPDILRALDVYTGRRLWEVELKGLGSYYNITRHFAGAGEIGSNYVTLPDAVYVAYQKRLLELDAATGKLRREITVPNEEPGSVVWGTPLSWGSFLIATAVPVSLPKKLPNSTTVPADRLLQPTRYASSSRRLMVFDRRSGKLLWQKRARYAFRHNCVVAGNGRLYCIDGLSPARIQQLKRRGIRLDGQSRLLALDLKTGREIWSTSENVFGTFLNYSEQHDVLLQAGSAYRDRAADEISRGMTAYRGSDGKVLWSNPDLQYGGPCLLWRDKIITNGSGGFQLELLTGRKTGWTYTRMYGCNTAIGAENLLTFRSGAAGFYDLAGDSGTGNLGGFRSSCTSNLIAADGVLSAPDYTFTCSCAYQNQTSLAFIPMPQNDLWTFNRRSVDFTTAKRIGLNLGAPGDRRSAAGTLWLDVPAVGGPSPDVAVTFEPAESSLRWFRRHSSFLKGKSLKWVAASGGEGIRRLQFRLGKRGGKQRRYTVRLVFAEPENLSAGQRRFSVQLQGKTVLTDFDIVQTAGENRRVVLREFPHVAVQDTLEIRLQPSAGSQYPPLLCGVELIRTD